MRINSDTRIAAILKHHPDALEAIVRIRPAFEKLRNPFLRKMLAGRTSLAMASRIGNCELSDFYAALAPLGFSADEKPASGTHTGQQHYFVPALNNGPVAELDVRPILSGGNDPLQQILAAVKNLRPGETLKIINTFEPAPLISLLEKKGYVSFTDTRDPDTVETYFYKKPESTTGTASPISVYPDSFPAKGDLIPGNPDELTDAVSLSRTATEDWETVLNHFDSRIQTIDVRQLEMPLPMITILETLDKLPVDTALFVHHKRIPVFLIPELNSRGFRYRIQEIAEGNVQMLIFKE